MRLGIGGGIGPLRGGISTRGVGVGVGPVSAGSGWGSAGVLAPLFGLLLGLAAAYYAIVWPFLLGAYIAEQLGAENPSTARAISGWVFESVYLGLIAVVIIGAILRWVEGQRESKYALAQQEALDELEETERVLSALVEERDSRFARIETYENTIAHFRTSPGGVRNDHTPAGERSFLFTGSYLAQPRVAYRNGPKVLTEIEFGTLHITDKAIRFVGASASTRR